MNFLQGDGKLNQRKEQMTSFKFRLREALRRNTHRTNYRQHSASEQTNFRVV